MFGRRRKQGTGMGGILVLGAALYFTGGGQWLWERTRGLEGQCYAAMAQLRTAAGGKVCAGLGKAVNGVGSVVATVGDTAAQVKDRIAAMLEGTSLPSALGELRVSSALAQLGSSPQALQQRLQLGPQSLGGGQNLQEQIRSAVDSFVIGKNYLGGDGGAVYKAVPWLQQGAQVPGYGVLSQLSLGDLFSGASVGGVGVDKQAAVSYYRQAYQSIGQLQVADTTEARSVLQSLPAGPEALKQQLLERIAGLQAQ